MPIAYSISDAFFHEEVTRSLIHSGILDWAICRRNRPAVSRVSGFMLKRDLALRLDRPNKTNGNWFRLASDMECHCVLVVSLIGFPVSCACPQKPCRRLRKLLVRSIVDMGEMWQRIILTIGLLA